MRTPILLIFLFGFSIIYDVEAYPATHEPTDKNVYGIQHCIKMTQENEEKISAIATKLSEFIYNLTIEHEVFDIRFLKIVIEGHSDDEVEEKDTQVQLVVNDCAKTNEFTDGEELEEVIYQEDPYKMKESIEIDFEDPVNEKTTDENNTTSANENNPSNDIENDSLKSDADNYDAENTNGGEKSTITNDESTNEPVSYNNDTENTYNNKKLTRTNDKSTTEPVDENNDKTNDKKTDVNRSERYSTDNVESGKSKINIDNIQPSSSANYEVPGPVVVRLDLDKNGNKLIRRTQVKRGEHVPLLLYVQRVSGNVQYIFAN